MTPPAGALLSFHRMTPPAGALLAAPRVTPTRPPLLQFVERVFIRIILPRQLALIEIVRRIAIA